MPQGRKGACVGAKASQHFSMCSCCQVSQHIIAVPCVAPTFFARHHSCACCPLVLAHWLPTASRGPHSRCPSHASAVQHMTTCRACGSGALRRPVFSSLDCSVLSWRPIHPGQLEPTTIPFRRLALVSCSEGLSPTLSLPISLALSCSLSPVAPLCSFPTVLYPLSLSLFLSLSPSRPKKGVRVVRCIPLPPGVRTILYGTEEVWCIHWATTLEEYGPLSRGAGSPDASPVSSSLSMGTIPKDDQSALVPSDSDPDPPLKPTVDSHPDDDLGATC